MFPRVILSLVLCTAVTLGAFPAVGMKENLAPASFDSYEITLVDGETLNMRLLSGRIIFDSSRNQKFYVTLSKTKNKRPVKTFTVSGGTFDVEVASLMDENGQLMNVMKKLPVQDIFKARQDFLQNVEDGDEYDARYVLTDEGREYLNSLLEAEDGSD